MDKNQFIQNFRNAFGNYELPVAFWYSEKPVAPEEKTRGCFIGSLKPAREGQVVTLSANTISCGGGRLYTGFCEMGNHIPTFVSEKEHYKQTNSRTGEELYCGFKHARPVGFVSQLCHHRPD